MPAGKDNSLQCGHIGQVKRQLFRLHYRNRDGWNLIAFEPCDIAASIRLRANNDDKISHALASQKYTGPTMRHHRKLA
jgi:hypothetical protein